MAPEDVRSRAVSAYDAAGSLGRAPSTIHGWALRYGARKVRKEGRKVLYDYDDLVVIERELYHGHSVPATWQARAEIRERCPLKAAQVLAHAA
jgi:hypothetical protein